MEVPLHHGIIQHFTQILDEVEQKRVNLLMERGALLELLRAAKDGELDLQTVVITDDGWQLMPPEPEESPLFHSSNGIDKTLAGVLGHE